MKVIAECGHCGQQYKMEETDSFRCEDCGEPVSGSEDKIRVVEGE